MKSIVDVFTNTLTIITTYTCTAACKECCFGCTPRIKGQLSGETIRERISEARDSFPALQLVVFSGGECFLLKDELYACISHAHSLGLATRCVTNGFWGKTVGKAHSTAERLLASRVDEINISTGKDHQEWVPFNSVVNAASALTQNGIRTLVTIEQDTVDSACRKSVLEHPAVRQLLRDHSDKFSVMSNSWMPFTHEAEQRDPDIVIENLRGGCGQVFENVVVTPHDQLSACCGLTLEHIPEMKLGSLDGVNMRQTYEGQSRDFMKIWLRVEGPYRIIERVLGEERAAEILSGVNHICQACAILHLSSEIRDEVLANWEKFVPGVVSKFALEHELRKREIVRHNVA